MSLSLDDPRWIFLIAVGLACAAIGWRWMRAVPRARRSLAMIARVLLVSAVALALAGLHARRPADRMAVVGVIDLSGSVRSYADFGLDESGLRRAPQDAVGAFLRRAARGQQPDDLFGLVVFDGRATVIATPAPGDPLERPFSIEPTDGTDLVGAVRLARALLPADTRGRVVLISDGRPTTGSLDEIAPGAPVDVAPIDYTVERETIVESFDLPPRSVSGAEVAGRVVIRSTSDARGTLTVLRDGRPVDLTPDTPGDGVRIDLPEGRHVIPIGLTLPEGRVHRYEAIYEPDRSVRAGSPPALFGDASIANNRAAAYTITRSPGSVLFVDGRGVGDGGVLVRTLRAAGREVEIVSPQGFPTDLIALEEHDLVVLEDTAFDVLPAGTDARLDAYARSFGGGIILVGGRSALTAGGWKGSAIEDALPVRLEIPDRVVMPETAVVFVLDRSGSMRRKVMGSSRSQQDIANEAAAGAIDTLDPTDLVGVIAFSNDARVVVPLAENDDTDGTRASVLGISSDGGTNLAVALEAARAQLARVSTKSKHVIVLSDGVSQETERLSGLAKELAALGARVSTIAVGDEADADTLRSVAEQGNGVFYRVTNPTVLPQVFIKAIRVLREPAVRDTPFDPIVLDPDAPLLAGVGAIPRLGGLVLTTRRDRASTPVVSPDDEPVVASWPVELGRVSAITTDADAWASGWADQPGFARFWSNAIAWTARAIEDTPGELRVVGHADRAELTYEAQDSDGAPIDGMDVGVRLYAPDGSARTVALQQVGPGRYEGSARGLPEGVVVAASDARRDGQRLPPSITGVQVRTGAEDLALSSDPRGMRALAQRTGGRVLDWTSPADLFERDGPPRVIRSALWPMLLIVTLALFLIDVAMRRLAWDRWVDAARADTLAATGARSVSIADLRRTPRPDQPRVETDADSERQRIERERVQRQIAEARARGASTPPPATTSASIPTSSAPPSGPNPQQGANETEPSGLLAAKRRAKRRFDGSNTDDAQPGSG